MTIVLKFKEGEARRKIKKKISIALMCCFNNLSYFAFRILYPGSNFVNGLTLSDFKWRTLVLLTR